MNKFLWLMDENDEFIYINIDNIYSISWQINYKNKDMADIEIESNNFDYIKQYKSTLNYIQHALRLLEIKC